MNQYRRGVRVEYLLKKKLESERYYVVRSAGSHGAADLVAWNDKACYVIQVALTGVKTKKDYDKLKSVPQMPRMVKQMWEYLGGGEWKVTKV